MVDCVLGVILNSVSWLLHFVYTSVNLSGLLALCCTEKVEIKLKVGKEKTIERDKYIKCMLQWDITKRLFL